MEIDVITLFPHMFEPVFSSSIMGRAREAGYYNLNIYNLRDFTNTKHRVVDDYPYGGGSGMVLKPEPLWEAVEFLKDKSPSCNTRIILMSPLGRTFNHEVAMELKELDRLILICGHYEGVDERVREHLIDCELSVGDFILTGGELPAMIIMDALIRLLPGVLPEESVQTDSFYNSLLSCPQYTRPRAFRDHIVPDILLSGNHKEIERWRRAKALKTTKALRPDLLEKINLSSKDKKLLDED